METHIRTRRSFWQRYWVGIILGHIGVLVGLAALFFGSLSGLAPVSAFAQSGCSGSAQTSATASGVSGDVAVHGQVGRQSLTTLLTVANVLSTNTAACAANASSSGPARGQRNPFPYGSCTWWAAQRYHQLTGIYVPWTTRANAWQWTARARQFSWNVSSQPSVGAILVLQPWVQWAYGAGHVAVVERILPNGRVVTSNMSWGRHPWQVTYVTFKPGRGVTFLSF